MEFVSDSKEWMPPEERQRYLNEGLRKLVQQSYQSVPAVKAILDRAGIQPSEIRTIEDLEKVPVTRKDDFVKLQRENPPFGGFLGKPIESLKRISMAPGPTYIPELVASSFARLFYGAGYRQGDRVIVTFNYHLGPGGLCVDDALELMGITIINGGVGNTELQVQVMRELKVTGFVGTPSFLMTVIQTAERLGYDFRRDFEIKRAMFSAEPLTPSVRRTLEEDYGIDTCQWYGLVEVGIIGYDCSAKSGMHFGEDMIVELIDHETGKHVGPGQSGEIVATPLEGTLPLLRYGTGDLSSYTEEPCPCGRTSYRLLRVMGRVGDAVKVRGLYVHARQVEEVVSKFPELSKAQIVINRVGHRDEMTLRVELEDESADKDKLLKAIHESIRGICRVRADKVDFLSKGTIPEEYKKVEDQRTWE